MFVVYVFSVFLYHFYLCKYWRTARDVHIEDYFTHTSRKENFITKLSNNFSVILFQGKKNNGKVTLSNNFSVILFQGKKITEKLFHQITSPLIFFKVKNNGKVIRNLGNKSFLSWSGPRNNPEYLWACL